MNPAPQQPQDRAAWLFPKLPRAKTIGTPFDLTGRRFGHLVALRLASNDGFVCRSLRWTCVCDCGTEHAVRGDKLRDGSIRSCGCKQGPAKTHGQTKSPEYRIWRGMLTRCTNPAANNFQNYGGRAIGVCDKWASDFAAFLADVGKRPSPSHSLDRIDNAAGYHPGNVRWATKQEQMRNTRANVYLTHAGTTATLTDWATSIGINKGTLGDRIKRLGWSVERALTTPAGNNGRKHRA